MKERLQLNDITFNVSDLSDKEGIDIVQQDVHQLIHMHIIKTDNPSRHFRKQRKHKDISNIIPSK